MRCKNETQVYGNIWIKRMTFKKKGDVKIAHQHKFDHLHMVVKGSVQVHFGMEDVGIFKEGDIIKVPKEERHEVVALEDNTIAVCMQAFRDKDIKEVLETDYALGEVAEPTVGRMLL